MVDKDGHFKVVTNVYKPLKLLNHWIVNSEIKFMYQI